MHPFQMGCLLRHNVTQGSSTYFHFSFAPNNITLLCLDGPQPLYPFVLFLVPRLSVWKVINVDSISNRYEPVHVVCTFSSESWQTVFPGIGSFYLGYEICPHRAFIVFHSSMGSGMMFSCSLLILVICVLRVFSWLEARRFC